VLSLLVPAVAARGQGLIVDHRPNVPISGAYEVRSINIDARIRDQVAEVQVAQTFHNPGSFQLEAEFLFPLPDEGGIQNMVLLVDGKELTGRLLPKDEARRIFEEIVRTKRDPALLEYMGQGLMRTSVFPIPPGADRTVTFRYTKLCKRDHDVVEFSYPFTAQKYTRKPIQKLDLTVRLESREPIKSVYSPMAVEIRRTGDHEVLVRAEQRDVIPSGDFQLVYTLSSGSVGASVLSYRPSAGDDGYALVLASPEVPKATGELPNKTVVFVLDRSGSMTGKKIEQARNALKFVLENLREGDTFNILTYDDRVETFRPELQRYASDTKAAALKYVENIYPGGSTNIDEALRTALKQVQDRSRPSYILFLTDGLPTAGDTNEAAIADHVKTANQNHARLFVFGVGNDVNSRLLDRLSGGNSGTSDYVRPDEDIEGKVSSFFRKLTSPVLSDIRLSFEGVDVNRSYPRDIPDLFEGGQIVWVGRYRDARSTRLVLEGKVGNESKRFEFPVELAREGEGGSYKFVETLWAVRRVGYLIDQIDLHGQNKELIDELVELSKNYGILTPYTSFLADERVNIHLRADLGRRAGEQLSQLHEAEGQLGVAQRAAKGRYLNSNSAGSNTEYYAVQAKRQAGGAPAAPAGAAIGGGGLGGQAGFVPATNGLIAPTDAANLAAKPAANAVAVYAEDAQGRVQMAENVRRVGSKTFFKRGERWIDSTVSADQEKNAQTLEQFSDGYFELARKQTAELNQYLTFEEPVTVNLAGQTYKIDRPKRP
jgi:Ca-activated chloride channel family protein